MTAKYVNTPSTRSLDCYNQHQSEDEPMPLRQKSPNFDEVLKREVHASPESVLTWAAKALDDSRYLHWSELIQRTPPGGLTHKQWWLGLKLRRNASQRVVPLTNKAGNRFTFTLTDKILQSVESIAARLGGPRELTSGTLTPAARDIRAHSPAPSRNRAALSTPVMNPSRHSCSFPVSGGFTPSRTSSAHFRRR